MGTTIRGDQIRLALGLAVDATTKELLYSGSLKNAVRAATTGNINLATHGLAAVDEITPVAGDRILVREQSSPTQEGIYIAASGPWLRAADWVTGDIVVGAVVYVGGDGTLNGNSAWSVTATPAVVNNHDPLFFQNVTRVDTAGGLAFSAAGRATLAGGTLTAGTFTVSGTGVLAIATGADLTITDAPVSATDAVNKTYVDSLLSGLSWLSPVNTFNLIGNIQVTGLIGAAAASVIEVLTVAGDSYIVETADGSGDLSTATVGDIWQYVGSTWTLIVTGSGGFVPANTYATLTTTGTRIAPYTGDVDGDRVAFAGADREGTNASPTAGDAYVVDGSGATGEGNIIEWSESAAWAVLEIANGSQFVEAGVRAILSKTTTLIPPYASSNQETEIYDFDGSSNTGNDTNETADAKALLIQDTGHIGVFDNLGYVYEGVVNSGTWIQFTGVGQIVAGAGLTKTANTLDVGAGDGITANVDDIAVKPDVTTGGDTQPVEVAANGVGLDINAIAGTGLSADGSANLQIAAQGNGLTGGGGTTIAVGAGDGITVNASDITVKPDVTTGGDTQPVEVVANGVGLDINAIAGTGLSADGSANLQIAAQGNGLTGGGGTTIAVGAGDGITVNASDITVNAENGTLKVSSTGVAVNHVKYPVLLATTADLSATYNSTGGGGNGQFTGAPTPVDGVAMAQNDRILVKDQTNQDENGIYVVQATTTTWNRATDFDLADEVFPGVMVVVDEGTANANTAWMQTEIIVTVGTGSGSNIGFGQIGGSTLSGGDGIDITTDTISVDIFVQEAVGGTKNGSNTAFTIANTPASINALVALMIFHNGVLQESGGVDYTQSGTSITMAVAPEASDTLWATYWV